MRLAPELEKFLPTEADGDVNRGEMARLSIAVHMQDESNRYQCHRNEHGVPWHITNDDLARTRSA